MGKINPVGLDKENTRYYSDRTFIFFFSVSILSLILCLFGRMDGIAASAIVCASIGGWTTKRSFEIKNLPDLIRSKIGEFFPPKKNKAT